MNNELIVNLLRKLKTHLPKPEDKTAHLINNLVGKEILNPKTMIPYFEDWPGDTWISISPNQDLNLWKSDDDHCHATVYDVVNGKTITDYWKTIFTTAEYNK